VTRNGDVKLPDKISPGGQQHCEVSRNAAGEFADIEKMVRPVEAAKALGNAMGAKIGPQVNRMRAGA